METFGSVHLLFNNAGIGAAGLIWENTVRDWEWALGVNLWGVIHGMRAFTPLMLTAAKSDPRNPDILLGKAYFALGTLRIPSSFFILERRSSAAWTP